MHVHHYSPKRHYRIKAEGPTDPQDSAFGRTAAATTSPGSVFASAAGNSQINVSWSGNAANDSITGYTVATNTSASFSGATYQYADANLPPTVTNYP